jgi:hypothetical protein
MERAVPRGVVFARLFTFRHQFRGGSYIRARHYNLNFHSIQTSGTLDASRGGSHATVSKLNLKDLARRNLVPRGRGIFLLIDVDGRVDNESPPNQNGDVDWPLRHMTNENNSEQCNHKQKCDGGPGQFGVCVVPHHALLHSWMQNQTTAQSARSHSHDRGIQPRQSGTCSDSRASLRYPQKWWLFCGLFLTVSPTAPPRFTLGPVKSPAF